MYKLKVSLILELYKSFTLNFTLLYLQKYRFELYKNQLFYKVFYNFIYRFIIYLLFYFNNIIIYLFNKYFFIILIKKY
jgi:hypothetical protein